MDGAVMDHRVILIGCQIGRQPHILAAYGCVGDTLAPIPYYLTGPYIKGRPAGGTDWAIVPVTLFVKLTEWKGGIALPVHDTTVASIAHNVV